MSTLRRQVLRALTVLSVALFSILVLVVMWQVVSRQVLQHPSTWSTTVAQYLFVWLSLFAIALVFGERGHVAVDVVATRLPAPARRTVLVLVQLAILVFALLALVWGGMRGVLISWDQVIPGIPLSVGQMYLALPVSGLLIALFALDDAVAAARGRDVLPAADAEEQQAQELADDLARPAEEG
ncbi:TRAP transporter small permease [Brachybacterium subflavum]|uniref:TRAP transporter small permease n=1 Tax=Brachybacterium subflavum TaxID=2585206 RepID=UPI0012665D7E|nr:TRAP transporter small permease [Brachybacterium subflavum]